MLRTLYFTMYTKVNKQLMKCFVLYISLRIPGLKTVNEMLRIFTMYTKVR